MDTHSQAPAQAGDGDAPNQSLRVKINQMTEGAVSPDPKSAFVNDVWPKLQNEYDAMRERLEEFCKSALERKAIDCQVKSRTKQVDSIRKSLDRREKALLDRSQKQFESFSDIFSNIRDLVGLRIILEFADDMERAVRFIKESFRKEEEPVIFVRDREVGRSWKTRFGAYETRNYRVSLEKAKCEALSQFCDVMFEIQVTTIAEDLYNKLAHPLLYKGLSLTRQDEIVIDMAHGNALCYALCLAYMEDKLKKRTNKIGGRAELVTATEEIARDGTRFRESLTKGASFDTTPVSPHGLLEALEIPPEGYNSVDDLKQWIDGKMTGVLDDIRSNSQTIRDAILSKLPIANGAAFDSHMDEHDARCHPDTRVGLQQDIMAWADDPQGECIFWLNGMAGTGKSTISRTVAQSFADQSLLGASFFFKRGERDRNNAALLFTTIATQLVVKEPSLASYIKAAIEADPYVTSKRLGEQFKKLILEPLENLKGSLDNIKTIVLVIDALDECERDDDVRVIISLLSQAKSLSSVRLRAFLTSRPELPIRLGFNKIKGKYQDLVLHEIPKPIIEHDIAVYLDSELENIRNDYNDLSPCGRQLPHDWPGSQIVKDLVQMAVPLFIFAATACRFIRDRKYGGPDRQLAKLLAYQTSQQSKLDTTYLPVLEPLFIDLTDSDHDFLDEFQQIVGTIVLLAEPLSTTSLSKLIQIDRNVVIDRLDSLHSVLNVPASAESPVRIFHLSFRDFLVDPDKAKEQEKYPFWVDEKATHKRIATRCLDLLSDYLKKDICDLRMPGTARADIESSVIDLHLPSDVRYACLYWVYHVQHSSSRISDDHQVYTFLERHFLHWLEALSLLGKISASVGMIRDLQGLLSSDISSTVSAFLHDAARFILSFHQIIDLCPLQTYASAIIFAPMKSIIRGVFRGYIPEWMPLLPKVDLEWNACLQTLEGHGHSVTAVAFSPDGTTLASASYDKTVRLWDIATGEHRRTLEGHGDSVTAVAFSPDGTTLASASDDKTVRLWDIATGEHRRTLEGHGHSVTAVAFSPDGTTLASASYDKTVQLWDMATGEHRRTLEGHGHSVTTVAFSPDGTTLASASYDKTVQLWDMATGEHRRTLEGHGDWVTAVAFSPDGTTLASASHDKTVRLWDIATGEHRRTLEGHGDSVTTVAFSPDGTTLASASYDKTVQLCNVATGEHRRTLEGHGHSVTTVAFSPDGTTLASASDDKTVRLYDVATGEHRRTLEGHGYSVIAVAFSPDGTTLASASDDRTVRLWDVATGEHRRTLKGHGHLVTAVAFSPDGTTLASASDDETVRLWDVATGEHRRTLEGHGDWVTAVAFSPDGTTLASASDDETVRLWDVATGEHRRTLEGHDGDWVTAVAFSPDGTTLASASADKTVRLWDVATGEHRRTLKVHCTLERLSFLDSDCLETDRGLLRITPSPANNFTDQKPGSGLLFVGDKWITRDGKNLIWLPPNYRARYTAVYNCTIALGHASGQVGLFRFAFKGWTS